MDSGFEAIVVSVRDGLLSKEWLGRKVDEKFMRDLSDSDKPIDPCGENGEFHTLVIDGPIFKKKIAIVKSEPTLREGYWFLDITEFKSLEK